MRCCVNGSALTKLIAGFTFTTGDDISGGATATFTGIPSTATNIRVYWFGITPGSGYPEWRFLDIQVEILQLDILINTFT